MVLILTPKYLSIQQAANTNKNHFISTVGVRYPFYPLRATSSLNLDSINIEKPEHAQIAEVISGDTKLLVLMIRWANYRQGRAKLSAASGLLQDSHDAVF
ncbi:MAG: membrane protein insertase Oxa1/YidC/SpoIIIJ [Pseudohongiellaceae bacterium]